MVYLDADMVHVTTGQLHRVSTCKLIALPFKGRLNQIAAKSYNIGLFTFVCINRTLFEQGAMHGRITAKATPTSK